MKVIWEKQNNAARFILTEEQQVQIEEKWKRVNEWRTGLYNGDLLRVVEIKNIGDGEIKLLLASDISYKEIVGLRYLDGVQTNPISHPEKFKVLSCYIFVKTSDGKYIFIERDCGDWQKAYDFCGGFVQDKHFSLGPTGFVKHRLAEDLGVLERIKDINFVGTFDATNILELMLVYEVVLDLTFSELQKLSRVKIFSKDDQLTPIHPPLLPVLAKFIVI